MQSHHAEFEARGARVVAVAQGSGDEADGFCRDLGIDYPCLGDPQKDVYGLFSLPRASWWNVTVAPFLEEYERLLFTPEARQARHTHLRRFIR